MLPHPVFKFLDIFLKEQISCRGANPPNIRTRLANLSSQVTVVFISLKSLKVLFLTAIALLSLALSGHLHSVRIPSPCVPAVEAGFNPYRYFRPDMRIRHQASSIKDGSKALITGRLHLNRPSNFIWATTILWPNVERNDTRECTTALRASFL